MHKIQNMQNFQFKPLSLINKLDHKHLTSLKISIAFCTLIDDDYEPNKSRFHQNTSNINTTAINNDNTATKARSKRKSLNC